MRLLFVNPPAIPESVKTARVKAYVEHNRHYQQVWNIVNLDDTVLYPPRRSAIPTLILWGSRIKSSPFPARTDSIAASRAANWFG